MPTKKCKYKKWKKGNKNQGKRTDLTSAGRPAEVKKGRFIPSAGRPADLKDSEHPTRAKASEFFNVCRWTQEEIGEVVELAQNAVSKNITKFNLLNLVIKSDY
ncbi:MAG: hypothetical protein J7L78_03070 [Dehalococcoidales bacterium]|nr:hypothetical protein [Dehalococcoidales bacterium]